MKPNSELAARILTEDVTEAIDRASLLKKLTSGRRLRVKLGADPTAPDLHLGHAVLLWKLRQFQEAGHEIIFIIGDFTVRIGDPSGRSEARPVLSPAEIAGNAKTYFRQAGKILDLKKVRVRKNSEWLSKLKLSDWLSILKEFTVSRIIEREDFKKRLSGGAEVWLHEIMYPLLQAYDSVAVRADVELGGPDQLFNLLAGRHLQEKKGQPPQDILVTDYLIGLDGEKKMSKSLGNYIGITEPAAQIFGKTMSIPDSLIPSYLRLAARKSADEANAVAARLRAGENPRDIKLELAKDIVSLYHGRAEGERSRAEFIRVFSRHELPREMEASDLPAGSYEAAALLITLRLAKSRSEAFRLVEQGGLEIIFPGGKRENPRDPRAIVRILPGTAVRAGKTRFVRIRE